MITANAADVDMCEISVIDRKRVEVARSLMPAIDETDRMAEWFRVLGDPTRTRLLYALLEVGELCVCDLSAVVGATESTVSHSLRWLRAAGIVRARRSGRMMYYSLDDEHVRMLLNLSREHVRHRERGR
ncbi:MAG: metalloregulator ArsR/SmtB family transcription factor [Actinomycetota bacterium]